MLYRKTVEAVVTSLVGYLMQLDQNSEATTYRRQGALALAVGLIAQPCDTWEVLYERLDRATANIFKGYRRTRATVDTIVENVI